MSAGTCARATVADEFVALTHCQAPCHIGHSGVQRLHDELSRCGLSAVPPGQMSVNSTHKQMISQPEHKTPMASGNTMGDKSV